MLKTCHEWVSFQHLFGNEYLRINSFDQKSEG